MNAVTSLLLSLHESCKLKLARHATCSERQKRRVSWKTKKASCVAGHPRKETWIGDDAIGHKLSVAGCILAKKTWLRWKQWVERKASKQGARATFCATIKRRRADGGDESASSKAALADVRENRDCRSQLNSVLSAALASRAAPPRCPVRRQNARASRQRSAASPDRKRTAKERVYPARQASSAHNWTWRLPLVKERAPSYLPCANGSWASSGSGSSASICSAPWFRPRHWFVDETQSQTLSGHLPINHCLWVIYRSDITHGERVGNVPCTNRIDRLNCLQLVLYAWLLTAQGR